MKIEYAPLISIAMATYNGAQFLSQQLDSIIEQSYKNIELVICDDCSTDETVRIINAYQAKHTFIKLYNNNSKLGFVKNFEKAISLSTGQYIALCDQDDIWYPEKLTVCINAIKQKESTYPNSPIMIHSDLALIDEKNILLQDSYFRFKNYKLKEGKDLGHIAGPCGVMGNTILFNQHLKKQILPFPDCLEFHDYWIALVNELIGERVTIRQKLIAYRIHTKNTSNTDKKLKKFSFSLRLLTNFFHRRIVPPFLRSKRATVIDHVIHRFDIHPEDKNILIYFQNYLQQKGPKNKHIYHLFRYSLIKRDIFYRIAFTMNYIIYKEGIKNS